MIKLFVCLLKLYSPMDLMENFQLERENRFQLVEHQTNH